METEKIVPKLSTPAGELPDLPEFKVLPEPKKHARKRALIAIVVLVLLLTVGGFSLLRYRHPDTETPKTQAPKSGASSRQASISAPAVAATTLGDVKAAYVTLALTKTQAETDPVSGPGQNFALAAGHYLLLDPRGFTYAQSNEGGKLLYDGRNVYDGPYLFRFALSPNGQHYLYELDTDPRHLAGSQEIFIDGKMVQSIPDGQIVYYPHVADNGKDYAYALGKTNGSSPAMELDKDGSTILTAPRGIEVLSFSADLTTYIAATPSGTSGEQYDVILNGQTVARSLNFMGTSEPSVALSPNGQHYLYTDGETVFLDGKAVRQGKGVAAMDVTSGGSYGIVDPLSDVLHVNGSSVAIPGSFAEECNSACSGGYPQFALSDDGSHYIYGTQYPNLWDLDNAAVTPSGDIQGVEFIGNVLYLYRWASDPYDGWLSYGDSHVSFKYPNNWQAGTGGVKYTPISVDVTSAATTIHGLTTVDNPGAAVTLSLHLSTDTLVSCSSDYPCQVAAVVPLNNPQLPHAVLAVIDQPNGNGTRDSQYEVVNDSAKVGDSTLSPVKAGGQSLYIFGQPYYTPTNSGLSQAALLSDTAAFQADTNVKDLVNLINSITLN